MSPLLRERAIRVYDQIVHSLVLVVRCSTAIRYFVPGAPASSRNARNARNRPMNAPGKDGRSTTFPLSDCSIDMLGDWENPQAKGCEGSGVRMFSEKVRMRRVGVVGVDAGDIVDSRWSR